MAERKPKFFKNEPPKVAIINRIPPQALEMEEFILGAILIDKDSILKVVDILNIDDFYQEKNGLIYEIMLHLFNNKEPIDILTVSQKLDIKDQLDSIGGE